MNKTNQFTQDWLDDALPTDTEVFILNANLGQVSVIPGKGIITDARLDKNKVITDLVADIGSVVEIISVLKNIGKVIVKANRSQLARIVGNSNIESFQISRQHKVPVR